MRSYPRLSHDHRPDRHDRFGSIGKGTLPLIERHFGFDKSRFTVIDPDDSDRAAGGRARLRLPASGDHPRELPRRARAAAYGRRRSALHRQPLGRRVLDRDANYAQEMGALYIDTVVEPWAGGYFDKSLTRRSATNYAMREKVLALKGQVRRQVDRGVLLRREPGDGVLVRQEGAPRHRPLTHRRLDREADHPRGLGPAHAQARREGRPHSPSVTPRSPTSRSRAASSSTPGRSRVLSEGMQPAELGWGTHEKWLPANAHKQTEGCGAAIFLAQPGRQHARALVVSDAGPQFGFLVTHNESISIADYFTVPLAGLAGQGAVPPDLPTLPTYAADPKRTARAVAARLFGAAGKLQEEHHILGVDEIESGIDELGVLVYGHARKNAYWYGSALQRGDQTARAVSERDRPAGVVGRPRRHGLGARPSERGRGRGRRARPRALPAGADAVSRPLQRLLTPTALEAALKERLLPRGSRHLGPLAVPQHPGALTRAPAGAGVAPGDHIAPGDRIASGDGGAELAERPTTGAGVATRT